MEVHACTLPLRGLGFFRQKTVPPNARLYENKDGGRKMKKAIAIAFVLFSGYVGADVVHPENTSIRGHIGSYGDDVCFNNDGSTDSVNCPDSLVPNEGYIFADGAS